MFRYKVFTTKETSAFSKYGLSEDNKTAHFCYRGGQSYKVTHKAGKTLVGFTKRFLASKSKGNFYRENVATRSWQHPDMNVERD